MYLGRNIFCRTTYLFKMKFIKLIFYSKSKILFIIFIDLKLSVRQKDCQKIILKAN